MFAPDYRNIVAAATNKTPARIPLYDHKVSHGIIEKIIGRPLCKFFDGPEKDLDAFFSEYCAFFKAAGYDTVTFEFCVTRILPFGGALANPQPGFIDSRETFDRYPWDSVMPLYIEKTAPYFDALRKNMPEGMKAIGGVGNGLFEIAQDLAGFENLCILGFTEPDVYAELFCKIGELLRQIWKWFLENYADVFCVMRFGDDLGFKSNTMLSHDDIRKHIVPQYKMLVEQIHGCGKPFLLHSCGCIFSVMEDLIETARIDAKHSNEDQIADMGRWVHDYGDRIGNFGGIDTDHLVRLEDGALKDKVTELYRLAEKKGRGFAIGSGNSIPDYVSIDKYKSMLNTVRALRGDEGRLL